MHAISLKAVIMVKTNEIKGTVTEQQFESAISKTKIKQKGKDIAYKVLVLGSDINEVAASNNMSYQRVKKICERVHSEVGNDKMMEFSVKLPTEIAPLVQQILTSVKTIYEQGNNKN